MTRNQFTKDVTKYAANLMFTVDGAGNISPTNEQQITRDGSLLIHASSSSTTPYNGYVCVRPDGGTCQCAAVISNLSGHPHMKVSTDAYSIKSDAPTGDFEVYAVTDGGNPLPGVTNGNIHITT